MCNDQAPALRPARAHNAHDARASAFSGQRPEQRCVADDLAARSPRGGEAAAPSSLAPGAPPATLARTAPRAEEALRHRGAGRSAIGTPRLAPGSGIGSSRGPAGLHAVGGRRRRLGRRSAAGAGAPDRAEQVRGGTSWGSLLALLQMAGAQRARGGDQRTSGATELAWGARSILPLPRLAQGAQLAQEGVALPAAHRRQELFTRTRHRCVAAEAASLARGGGSFQRGGEGRRRTTSALCVCAGTGKLHFAFPSTQQHLLVWRNRPQR